ncbi:MAG: hypothetical protein ACJ8LM_17880 [Candidatus Udaeobacter sp.]
MTDVEAALEAILKAIKVATDNWAIAKDNKSKAFYEGRISGLDKAIRVLQALQEG